jgi:hypothetical protein
MKCERIKDWARLGYCAAVHYKRFLKRVDIFQYSIVSFPLTFPNLLVCKF